MGGTIRLWTGLVLDMNWFCQLREIETASYSWWAEMSGSFIPQQLCHLLQANHLQPPECAHALWCAGPLWLQQWTGSYNVDTCAEVRTRHWLFKSALDSKIVLRSFNHSRLAARPSPNKEWHLEFLLVLRYQSTFGDGSANSESVIPIYVDFTEILTTGLLASSLSC